MTENFILLESIDFTEKYESMRYEHKRGKFVRWLRAIINDFRFKSLVRNHTVPEFDWKRSKMSADLFRGHTPKKAKEVFRENVEYVILETHSFCNRKCWFCSNSLPSLERTGPVKRMDESLVRKILSELAEIRYQGHISFSGYNEPLADPEFDAIVRITKEVFPQASFWINTNGDLLTREWIERLYQAGMRKLAVNLYVDGDEPYTFTYAKARDSINEKAAALGLDAAITTIDNTVACCGDAYYPSEAPEEERMYLFFRAENHAVMTNYRAGILTAQAVPKTNLFGRNRVCLGPSAQTIIYYDGLVVPCSNMRSEWDRHKQFVMGDTQKQTLWEIYTGEKMREFRIRHLANQNAWPCGQCSDYSNNWSFVNPRTGK